MTRARHGGRLSVIVVAAMTLGCGDRPPPALQVTRPSPPSAVSALPPIPGPPSPVAELVWGRDDASGQLAARLADGRFAAFRPTGGGAMTVVTGPEGEPPTRCVALADASRLATGHDAGVALWDTTSRPARLLGRLELGPVTALARVTGEAGEPALIVGGADGGLLRVRVAISGRLDRGTGHVPATGPAVAKIAVEPGGREVVVLREDGAATRHRADLIGTPIDAGPLRDLGFEPAEGKASVRQIDAYTLEVGPPPLRRFGAPGRPSSVALLDRGRRLAIGLEGGCVIVPIPASGPIPATDAIRVGGMTGTPVLAADPGDPAGRTLAVGDGAGRVERVGLATLIARGTPLALDDVPDLAYRPALRFGRPRTPLSPKADARLAPARKAIEAGDPASAIASLAALERHEATEPEIAAEARALLASVEVRSGEPSSSVRARIERAGEAFRRAGRIDRAADMEFWRGLILARPFEPDASGRVRRSSEEAGPALKRAASLYLRARPPLPRQARLAEAASAWVRLDLGDPSAAQERWAAVAHAARADPVLAQVAELDRIDAALAAAIGDEARAETAYGRILARLAPGDRPALRRRAAIGRAAALMALGRPADAAESLEPEAPGDAEWTLRRLACRLASGRPTRVAATSDDDPVAAHARALIALAGTEREAPDLAVDLALAADGHRRAGRDDLALEADLARAELAERSGRPDEAAERFAAIARALDALPDRDDARRGERPILALGPRATRGLARAEIAAKRPGRVLAALAPPAAEDRVGTIGLNREEFALAEGLDRARRVRETDGGEAAGLEVRRLETALAGRRRLRARVLDADGLGLSEDEALVAYAAVSPTATVGVLLRAGAEPRVAILPLGREPLAEAIGAWRAGLGEGGRPLAAEGPEPSAPIAGLGPEPDPFAPPVPSPGGTLEARLYDALLGPFAPDLDGVARLFVAPDGPVGGLPLEALGRDRRVIDRMEVAYLPAPGFLPALRSDDRADPASSDRLLFASPGAEREVRFWAVSCREAGWTVEALVGPRARPDAMTGPALAPYPVVHLAAPAAPVLASDPALSLSGGRWGASDLAAIPLRAKALVLQAGGASGSALRSWADAGLRAGAGAVVVTLWEPPALSARRFYAEFYREIRDGEAPSRAVAVGRAAVARDPRFRDPVHWAGYVTYGP